MKRSNFKVKTCDWGDWGESWHLIWKTKQLYPNLVYYLGHKDSCVGLDSSVDLIYSVKPAIWWHRMRSKIVEHQCANEIKGNLNDSDCHIMLLKKKQLCINVQSFPVL